MLLEMDRLGGIRRWSAKLVEHPRGTPDRRDRAQQRRREVLAAHRTPLKTRDLRIESIRPLISPAILLEELPLSEAGSVTVTRVRDDLIRILDGEDDRLIVV